MVKRAEIIEAARSCLGTKWVHQGRVPGQGIDCAGVILYTGKVLGVTDYEPPPYQRNAKWNEFLKHFQLCFEEIQIADVRPGDILVFRQEVFPCHCGIMTDPDEQGNLRFVHSYLIRHKVVEERYSNEWRTLTRAAFRYPGVED
ncbi:hypothetical protein GC176_20565 [bacterium]|nr:hypothetical protein [bacterium]